MSDQPSQSATIERTVSARAWQRFPQLLEAIERWSRLAGASCAGVIVSAVAPSPDVLSVRVSIPSGVGKEPDWLEWLAPCSFALADQLAIDHFATVHMHDAMTKLRGRGAAIGAMKDFTDLYQGDQQTMARPKPKPETKAPTATNGRGVPAADPKQKSARRPMQTAAAGMRDRPHATASPAPTPAVPPARAKAKAKKKKPAATPKPDMATASARAQAPKTPTAAKPKPKPKPN